MRIVLFAAVCLVACRSPLTPLTGDVYQLVSIAGVPLPAPYGQNLDFTGHIVADTIAFDSDFTGERRTTYDDGRIERGQTFTYSLRDGHIEIAYRCPDNGSCIAPPHLVGTLTSSDFVITESRISRQPLVFRRLYPPD